MDASKGNLSVADYKRWLNNQGKNMDLDTFDEYRKWKDKSKKNKKTTKKSVPMDIPTISEYREKIEYIRAQRRLREMGIAPKEKIINIRVGGFYKCVNDYKDKFVQGKEYEILQKDEERVTIRYYRDEKPVRFKMSILSFLSYFDIDYYKNNKKEEEEEIHDEFINPFDIDEWEDVEEKPIKKHIYSIGVGRDYDIYGYVLAQDGDEAKRMAKEMNLVPRDFQDMIRSSKITYKSNVFSDKKSYTEQEGYEEELSLRQKEADIATKSANSLRNSLKGWKEFNKK